MRDIIKGLAKPRSQVEDKKITIQMMMIHLQRIVITYTNLRISIPNQRNEAGHHQDQGLQMTTGITLIDRLMT